MASSPRIFLDRTEAGAALARKMRQKGFRKPILVLGLPRGGVPVAYEVARALNAPLDVMLVRKVGMPGQPELAIGAVASGGIVVHDWHTEAGMSDPEATFDRLARSERQELARREAVYRAGLPPLDLSGKHVILVDDGLATGSTMLAAIRAARKAGATEITAAAPIASAEAQQLIQDEVDALVVLQTPRRLVAIGQWYDNFQQVDDDEVCRLLKRRRETPAD